MTLSSIIAVAGGFIVMALAVGVGTPLIHAARKATPQGERPLGSALAADFVLGMVAAAAGGTFAVYIAPDRPLAHALALSALVVLMSVVCLLRLSDGIPRWYMAILTFASAALIAAIGWLHG